MRSPEEGKLAASFRSGRGSWYGDGDNNLFSLEKKFVEFTVTLDVTKAALQ